jgi:lysozyme
MGMIIVGINNFVYSKNGLLMTEGFEGVRLSAYLDGNKIPTIGYGHTAGVQMGDTCTQEQAEDWLVEDIKWAMSVVNDKVTVVLNQEEADALCDFIYNCGSGHFESSSLLRDINSGAFANAAADFEKWDICSGAVCAGLLRRRDAEATEFNS